MKIISLQLSNILSFRHVADVADAQLIGFDDDLNIIIGENGSGKSTALEVINFVFRRVLYRQYNFNQEFYAQRNTINVDQRQQTVSPANKNSFQGFRLEPNWDAEGLPQTIRISVKLDDIDKSNIQLLNDRRSILERWATRYSTKVLAPSLTYSDIYTVDISLNATNKKFSVSSVNAAQDFGYEYLTEYNFFKEMISLHNLDNPGSQIESLYESFTLISSFRNYHAFNISVSLRDHHPAVQMQQLRSADFDRSLNSNESSEPPIFALVRLRVAEKHFELISQKLDEAECDAAANDLQFIKDINNRLRVVNLRCKIRLLDLRTWQYSFEFLDLRRNKTITDINSLSAGQKAIVHLVFEAYGRGDLKGGLVIIDEPEIHLHYQFQHEYLQVIRELNKVQSCQYILVTHSEALINSTTIASVRRFSLNLDGHTEMHFPRLSAEQKLLVKVLDNTRSTYSFFAKKVVLVEGDTDRYFFRAVIQVLYPTLDQEIAILHAGSKTALEPWADLFSSYGLIVYRIGDLDCAYDQFYDGEKQESLKTDAAVSEFRRRHPDCDLRIEGAYKNRLYILKNGDLERYLGIRKDLSEVIDYCRKKLEVFLADHNNPWALEIRNIVEQISK